MGEFAPALLLGLLVLILVSAGIEDARIREISNRKNAAIALLALPWWFAMGLSPWPDMAVQAAMAAGAFALFALAFQFGMMGGGDVKMIAAIALWFPFTQFVNLLVIMSLAGGAITLLMLIDKWARRRSEPPEIPYGIAIAIAALLTLREPILNPLA
ncbi:prepilin peptidase [Sphingomonas sp. ST-64]|uniref:Prepilin peptidase n=1 Tax=Sphingomonas plantiphila TaxID=3163295 RepID=A0ABW8YL61_9SPHN